MSDTHNVLRPVLVTGAAGFAGSHLVESLQSDQRPVIAWYRPSEPLPCLGGTAADPGRSPVQWQAVEMLDRQAVEAAVTDEQPEIIYHCAGAPYPGTSWVDSYQTFRINVLCTHYLIEAVRQVVPDARVLVPGSALVYQHSTDPLSEDHPIGPSSPYGLSKLAQELVAARAAAEHCQVVLTRSFTHVGPRQHPAFVASSFAKQIAEIEHGKVPAVLRVGNLEARRDLSDVRDTVRAYRLIAERGIPGRPYNVCSGRAYTIREVLDGLLAHATVRLEIAVDPARLRPHDNPILLGDPRRIRTELGWSPEIAFTKTLGDLLDYWRTIVGARAHGG